MEHLGLNFLQPEDYYQRNNDTMRKAELYAKFIRNMEMYGESHPDYLLWANCAATIKTNLQKSDLLDQVNQNLHS